MKVLRIVIVVGMTFALAAGPASAAPPGNAIGSVSGGGWRLNLEDVPTVEFSVDAWMTPTGAISGSYHYANIGGLTLNGSVTCMDVEGNVAAIGGTVTSGSDGVGEDFLVFLTDNGAPVFGEYGPDQVSQTYIPVDLLDFPAICPDANENPFEPDPFSRLDILGDFTVNDRP